MWVWVWGGGWGGVGGRVAWPGVYRLGGADFTYKRPYNEPESLETDGPLGEDLILEVSRVVCGGGGRVAWPGVYRLGGADFTYKRPYNEPESLETDGPLGEDLILEVSRVVCGWVCGGGWWEGGLARGVQTGGCGLHLQEAIQQARVTGD